MEKYMLILIIIVIIGIILLLDKKCAGTIKCPDIPSSQYTHTPVGACLLKCDQASDICYRNCNPNDEECIRDCYQIKAHCYMQCVGKQSETTDCGCGSNNIKE